jgi:hypothetical protein
VACVSPASARRRKTPTLSSVAGSRSSAAPYRDPPAHLRLAGPPRSAPTLLACQPPTPDPDPRATIIHQPLGYPPEPPITIGRKETSARIYYPPSDDTSDLSFTTQLLPGAHILPAALSIARPRQRPSTLIPLPSVTTDSTDQTTARAHGAEQPPSPQSPSLSSGSTSPRLHRSIMQAMPDNRQQSFDEIYGPPENFLEIEVR